MCGSREEFMLQESQGRICRLSLQVAISKGWWKGVLLLLELRSILNVLSPSFPQWMQWNQGVPNTSRENSFTSCTLWFWEQRQQHTINHMCWPPFIMSLSRIPAPVFCFQSQAVLYRTLIFFIFLEYTQEKMCLFFLNTLTFALQYVWLILFFSYCSRSGWPPEHSNHFFSLLLHDW